jgi:hypothetical protein
MWVGVWLDLSNLSIVVSIFTAPIVVLILLEFFKRRIGEIRTKVYETPLSTMSDVQFCMRFLIEDTLHGEDQTEMIQKVIHQYIAYSGIKFP